MNQADKVVAKDMIRIMLIYGVILQVICLFMPGDRLRMAAGLWIGIASGIGLLIHMRNSLLEALDMDPEGAKRYMQKSYAVRYVTVVVIFMTVTYLDIVNIFTLIAGVMGLKISAYLQPIMHKLFKS